MTSPPLTVYCARPITQCSPVAIHDYYKRVAHRLREAGLHVLVPTTGKEQPPNWHSDATTWTKDSIKCVCTDHAIKERDRWMVQNSQVIFVNLIDTTMVSIGSIMELAWADLLGIHSVVVLQEHNIHRHPFVVDCADIVFPAEEEALVYLEKLALGIVT